MEVETELRDMFSYSYFWIIFMIILLVIVIVLLKVTKNKNKTVPKVVKEEIKVQPPKKNIWQIKNMYLKQIDELLVKINAGKISNRSAYQTLSKIIRNFVYEATSIKVQNYTLSEIKKVNMPILYELVEEYYDPEFSKNLVGNIINSLNKTKAVIEKWN